MPPLRQSGVGDPGPVLGDGSAVYAQVRARDHLRVLGGEEYASASVVTRARQVVHGQHLREVEDAAATVGPLAPPRLCAVVALGGIGGRRSEAVHADAVLDE